MQLQNKLHFNACTCLIDRIGSFLVLAAMTTFVMATPAHATEYAKIGDRGDRAFREVCPPRAYLVGLQMRSGLWVDQIAVKCVTVSSAGLPSTLTTLPAHGGSGGGPFTGPSTCPAGDVINGMHFSFTPNDRQVRQFTFDCRPIKGGGIQPLTMGSSANPSPPYHQVCPLHEVAVGLQGNEGLHVNAVGLICAAEPISTPTTAAEAAQIKRCQDYANTAVNQSKEWFARKCGPAGDRWSTDYQAHFAYCWSVGASSHQPEDDTQRRQGPLTQCRTAHPLPGSAPAPLPAACSSSVIIRIKQCLNADGSPSTTLAPGSLSVTACGANDSQALAIGKQRLGSQAALADSPTPNACTYSVQHVAGCLCH